MGSNKQPSTKTSKPIHAGSGAKGEHRSARQAGLIQEDQDLGEQPNSTSTTGTLHSADPDGPRSDAPRRSWSVKQKLNHKDHAFHVHQGGKHLADDNLFPKLGGDSNKLDLNQGDAGHGGDANQLEEVSSEDASDEEDAAEDASDEENFAEVDPEAPRAPEA